MSRIECFWLEPTRFQRVSLRRWTKAPCPSGEDYCLSSTPLMTIKRTQSRVDHWPRDDWRWPVLCAGCGRPFHEDHPARLIHETVYRWVGTAITLTISEAPPGAMWDAVWHKDKYPPGPDGRRLQVRLPDYVDWQVDREANEGEVKDGKFGRIWERTGEVDIVRPTVTVTPSVITQNGEGWNGKLVNGYLIEHIEEEDAIDEFLFEEDEDEG